MLSAYLEPLTRISHLKPFPLNCRLKNELSIRMELISLNRRLRPSFYVLISCAITWSSLRRLTAHADPIQTRIAGPYWKALCTGLLLNWILSGARACKWEWITILGQLSPSIHILTWYRAFFGLSEQSIMSKSTSFGVWNILKGKTLMRRSSILSVVG